MRILCLFFLLTAMSSLNAQESRAGKNSHKSDTIPFLLTEYNNLSVKAILNDVDTVQLMFHTAANAVTLTEEAIGRLKSLRFDGKTDSIKSWGNQSNTARFSPANTLRIGALTWSKVPIWENTNSGQYTDGKFGIDLFNNKVIEIDFDRNIICLHEQLPGNIQSYEKLNLQNRGELLFIEGVCSVKDSSYRNAFLLHSGYAGAILFDDKFAATNQLGEQLTITGEKTLKDSYGNAVKTKQSILPKLQFGNTILENPPAGFFEGTIGRQQMSVIGGDVLKRFNMVIDSKREYIYFHPNHLTNTPYRKI
jgi:hypothetical protein